jgi:predicted PurR-regulated permease PerM
VDGRGVRPVARPAAGAPAAGDDRGGDRGQNPWQRALYPPLAILAWLAVGAAVVWLLAHVAKAVLLVVLGVVLAYAFAPLAAFLERWLPRSLALAAAYVVGFGLVVGAGLLLTTTVAGQVVGLVDAAPTYIQQAQALRPKAEAVLAPLGVAPAALDSAQAEVAVGLQALGAEAARESLGVASEVVGTLVDLVLVVILSVYMAANGAAIADWLRRETPPRQRYRVEVLLTVINRVVGGYVRGVLLLATLIGVLVGLGMAVLGVPYAALLGVLAFFMAFVPVVGTLLSGGACVLVALLHFQDLLRPVLVLAYFVGVHVVEADLVGPRIMGRAVGIHPATGLIALVAGTELWGVWGALVAAPRAGLLQSIVVAAWVELRGGRPDEVLKAVAEEGGEDLAQRAGVT